MHFLQFLSSDFIELSALAEREQSPSKPAERFSSASQGFGSGHRCIIFIQIQMESYCQRAQLCKDSHQTSKSTQERPLGEGQASGLKGVVPNRVVGHQAQIITGVNARCPPAKPRSRLCNSVNSSNSDIS